jgi:hypothetical protein
MSPFRRIQQAGSRTLRIALVVVLVLGIAGVAVGGDTARPPGRSGGGIGMWDALRALVGARHSGTGRTAQRRPDTGGDLRGAGELPWMT